MTNELQITKPIKSIALWRQNSVPQVFETEKFFLLECRIAGAFYAKADKLITPETKLPVKLKLRREKDNYYDELAILVLTGQGEKLGYIPRSKNEILARLMDNGKALNAELFEYKNENNWLELRIKIYLEE